MTCVSVRDIQGQWREKDTQNIWTVNGIVAERAKRPKAQKKPVVLSDGSQGSVEWGNGNLKGKLEDGMLVWRNRRGEVTYCWQKFDSTMEFPYADLKTALPKVRRTPPQMTPPPVPRSSKIPPPPAKEEHSPRSTDSGNTVETAAMNFGMGGGVPALDAGVDEKADDIAVAEMKMLVEMAGKRLMAGDVYMSMRYITLAQQVQPVIGGYSETKQ
jgi:hypothetical protein